MLAETKKDSLIRRPLFCCIFSFIAPFSICSSAFALPFKSNAAAFESYANTRTWTDGNQRVFSQFYNCSFYGIHKGSSGDSEYDSATCGGGYVSIYSPQGMKVCELRSPGIQYERVLMQEGRRVNGRGKLYYGVQNCVMR